MKYCSQVTEALEFLRAAAGDFQPLTAIVLGSGLGKIADMVEDAGAVRIPASEIPHWPRSTAPGHDGEIVLGKLEGRPVVLLRGRVHLYEGCDMRQVVFPTRVLGLWKVRQYIGTNASGGIDASLKPGDIVLVEDHINYMGTNPLIGPVNPEWNVRFPDMTHAYSERLLDLCEKTAAEAGIRVRRGVYIAFSGPSYETPAEIRMARLMGATVVGMSTVPEVIVANAMGMETSVLSCVANQAAGITGAPLTEEEVLTEMRASSDRLSVLIRGIMKNL